MRTSIVRCRRIGIGSGGRNRSNAAASARRRIRPRIAPTRESNRLSVSSCWNRRPRPAPSESRVASSRRRAAPRARSRLATFKHALRIFISSTAIDLKGFREHVRDALLGLNNQPIAMETFSALGGEPASECKKLAAGADAVICIVAHRYGYVPPVELDGDGERSMTWLEVDAAKNAGKPVFAFLIDPDAPWTCLREEGRLVSEPEKAAEIVKAVQKLQEFKAHLKRVCTFATFASPEQLAER